MRALVRRLVRQRAANRCEYCPLHENDSPLFPFHIEHILPIKHGGTDNPRQLAWACIHCNLAKSSNLSGRDPATRRIVVLFNPRRQKWRRHFQWSGPRLLGLTACGRATIAVMNINAKRRIELRRLLIEAKRFRTD